MARVSDNEDEDIDLTYKPQELCDKLLASIGSECEQLIDFKLPVANMSKMIDLVLGLINKHLVLPPGGDTALLLWSLVTYLYDKFPAFPRLFVYSPFPNCGKSTTLQFIEGLADNGKIFSQISPASFLKKVDAGGHTFILDESDTYLVKTGEMTGIINSGAYKKGAIHSKCNNNNDPQDYITWRPVAIGGIGFDYLAEASKTRCIKIELQREKGEVKPINFDLIDAFENTRMVFAKWASSIPEEVINTHFKPHSLVNSRTVQMWTPLFTVAKLLGEDMLRKCDESYKA